MTSLPIFCLTLLLAGVRTEEEVNTPSKLLGPLNFNHHPFEAGQYLKEIKQPEPTKKGPVVFPNDAPPAPRTPLIVTSRPLIQSIARSELNQNPPEKQNAPENQNRRNNQNENSAEQSQLSRVQFRPDFVTPKSYQNFNYDASNYVTIGPTPVILVNAVTGKPVPFPGDYDDYPDYKNLYGGVLKKSQLRNRGYGEDNRFTDYEEKPTLPPLFKVLSDHANRKVLKLKQRNGGNNNYNNNFKAKDHSDQYEQNRLDNDQGDYSQNSNYAFSYKVKDQKTGDDFSHSQQSSGSATNGEYRVRLPDGRMQIVSYTADENGYKADVRYDDEDKAAGNSINYNDYGNNNVQRPSYTHNSPNRYDYNVNNVQNNNVEATAAAEQENYDYNIKNAYNHNYRNERRYQKPIPAPVKEDYDHQYPDAKDYDTEDYSLEYNGKNNNFQPHRSKFSKFSESKINEHQKSNVIVVPNEETNHNANLKPSIDELRKLFLNKERIQPTPDYLYSNIPIEISVPSTTPRTNHYEETTEHVVLIGGSTKPNIYTNVRNTVGPLSTPSPLYFSTPNFLGPSSAPLTKNIDFSGPKPVLSNRFIDRINRYLTY